MSPLTVFLLITSIVLFFYACLVSKSLRNMDMVKEGVLEYSGKQRVLWDITSLLYHKLKERYPLDEGEYYFNGDLKIKHCLTDEPLEAIPLSYSIYVIKNNAEEHYLIKLKQNQTNFSYMCASDNFVTNIRNSGVVGPVSPDGKVILDEKQIESETESFYKYLSESYSNAIKSIFKIDMIDGYASKYFSNHMILGESSVFSFRLIDDQNYLMKENNLEVNKKFRDFIYNN